MECIACTQCIDACDDIMTKINKPVGLIRYGSENEAPGKKRKLFTGRSIVYIAISVFFVSAFIYFLNASTNLQLVFMRGKTPFQMIDSGRTVLNQFTLKMGHQGNQHFEVNFSVKNPELKNLVSVVTPVHPTLINTTDKRVVIFFRFKPEILLGGTRKVTVEVFDELTNQIVATKEVVLVGPAH